MKFLLGFFLIIYVILFFYPRMRVSINGQQTTSLLYRALGVGIVGLILTLLIGLPIYGLVCLFG